MRESLLIHVGEHPAQDINWLVFNNNENEIIASGQLPSAQQLEQLSDKASQRQVTLIMSAAQVQLHQIALPTKWSRKLEKALPYMLEEQLAVDVEKMFVALGDAYSEQDKHFIKVAIVERAALQTWLDVCEQAQLTVEHIHVDGLLLPQPKANEASVITRSDDTLIMRGHDWQIAHLEGFWASEFLTACGIEKVDLYSDVPALESVSIESELQHDKLELPLAMFAKAKPEIDLRQGAFAYKKKRTGWIKVWRPALVACAVALVFNLGVKGAELYHYSSQAEATKQQVVSTYEKAFPGSKARVDLLRSQIRGALAQTGDEQDTGFLLLLENFAEVAGQSDKFIPQTLRYDQRRSELRVRARGKDFQSFGQVKASLEQRGFEVEQGSLNNEGESVVGELRIRGAV